MLTPSLFHTAGNKRRFVLSGRHLLELNRVAPQPQQPCSWFVDQSVKAGA
jgi:hypothetical protein